MDDMAANTAAAGRESWKPAASELRAAQREADRNSPRRRRPARADTLTGRLDAGSPPPVAGLVILLAILFVNVPGGVRLGDEPVMDLIAAGFDGLGGITRCSSGRPAAELHPNGVDFRVGSVIVFRRRS